jgi:hypothetical protein
VRVEVVAEDDNVINIHKGYLPFVTAKDLVHEALKDRRSIA